MRMTVRTGRWVRTHALLLLAAGCAPARAGEGDPFAIRRDGATLIVERGGRPVAVYQLRDREFPGHPEQSRCGYFHALYAPSGRRVTQDGPEDHLHHRGLFLAWTRVSWARDPARGWDESANFWELRANSGRRAPAEVLEAVAEDGAARFTVRHDWRLRDRVILRETLAARVAAPSPSAYRLDLDFSLVPVDGAVRLSENAHDEPGNPNYYGALGLRASEAFAPGNLVFTYADGRDHSAVEDGRIEGAWVDVTGDLEGGTCGAVLAWHPENPPSRLEHWRKLRFIDADLTALGPVTIGAGTALRLRYRVIVHDGTAAGARVEDLARW